MHWKPFAYYLNFYNQSYVYARARFYARMCARGFDEPQMEAAEAGPLPMGSLHIITYISVALVLSSWPYGSTLNANESVQRSVLGVGVGASRSSYNLRSAQPPLVAGWKENLHKAPKLE